MFIALLQIDGAQTLEDTWKQMQAKLRSHLQYWTNWLYYSEAKLEQVNLLLFPFYGFDAVKPKAFELSKRGQLI